MDRIVKRYQPRFDTAGNLQLPTRRRLSLGALVYARREHSYAIDTASCLLMPSNGIPIEGPHEIDLLDALTEQRRRFMKRLRYDARTAGQFANVLLPEPGNTPTPLHVVSAFAFVRKCLVKQMLLNDAEGFWV